MGSRGPRAPSRRLPRTRSLAPSPAFDPAVVLAGYNRWLARQPLAAATRLSYRASTAGYLAWLSERTSGHGDPLAEASARDYATRDYKRHLKDRRRTPRTVNKVLAGLDSFYRYLGLAPPDVQRENLPAQAPRALNVDEQRELLRAVQRRGVARDRAIVALALFAGLRLAEMTGLDVDDLALSARRGRVP